MATRNYRVGDIATDTPGDILCLRAKTTGVSRYDVFKNNGTPYLTGASTVLYIGRVVFAADSGGLSFTTITYGTTAMSDDAAAPSSNTEKIGGFSQGGPSVGCTSYNVIIPIPSSRYPHIYSVQANSSHLVTAFGIEV